MPQDGKRPITRRAVARRQGISTVTTPATASSPGSISSSTASTSISPTSAPTSNDILQSQGPQVITLYDGEMDADAACTAALPEGGIIRFNDSYGLELKEPLVFSGPCGNYTNFVGGHFQDGNSTVAPLGDPFYASIAPQVYALATATVVSYMLVIILFITPRTFYVGGPGGSSTRLGTSRGLLGRSMTFIGTGSSNTSVVGIGRRPLLQKIATLTVAISLTIATSDTFKVAEQQYNSGFMDASSLVHKVIGSLEIRIVRVISDAFLWLAQVQTLIRLFPRHKEKVTIKWLGFGLITCDTIFSILENVNEQNKVRPESFTDAIPALSYLFELAISLIYASCVVYYSLSKRRFAFWHAKMRNIFLMALMSLTAILIPVVFFIVDVAQPNIATWGEYIRWVGSAAASVVVWEWVERIEALERDEKKDGILGREIFDGDEMLDMTPSEEGSGDNGGGAVLSSDSRRPENKAKSIRFRGFKAINVNTHVPFIGRQKKDVQQQKSTRKQSIVGANGMIARPVQAATPISRSDTNSAASTVYAVRFHNPLSPSPAIPENEVINIPAHDPNPSAESTEETTSTDASANEGEIILSEKEPEVEITATATGGRQIWQNVANPFKRKRAEPPAEVAAQIAQSNSRRSPADRSRSIRNKFNAFASTQRQRLGGRPKARTPLGVTVIPAQPRLSKVDDGVVITAESGSQSEVEAPKKASGDDGGDATPQQGSLPVTVIPPPVKGGRTWSPDDMYNAQSQNRHDSGSSSIPSAGSRTVDAQAGRYATTPASSSRQSQQPTPPTTRSPGPSTNSPGSRSMLQAPSFGRNRAASATSMSVRLGEQPATTATTTTTTTSPLSISGMRSKTNYRGASTSPPAFSVSSRPLSSSPSNNTASVQGRHEESSDSGTMVAASSAIPPPGSPPSSSRTPQSHSTGSAVDASQSISEEPSDSR